MFQKKYLIYYLTILVNFITFIFGFWDFDFGDYSVQINNLLSGKFLIDHGKPILRYPPLTSILYAIIIKCSFNIKVGIFLLHNILSLLILYIGDKIINIFIQISNQKIQLIKLIIILNPFLYSFVLRGVNSELLFILINLLVLLILIRISSNSDSTQKLLLFSLSILLGLSILTRTQGFALMLTIFTYFVVKRKFKSIIFILIFTTITILP